MAQALSPPFLAQFLAGARSAAAVLRLRGAAEYTRRYSCSQVSRIPRCFLNPALGAFTSCRLRSSTARLCALAVRVPSGRHRDVARPRALCPRGLGAAVASLRIHRADLEQAWCVGAALTLSGISCLPTAAVDSCRRVCRAPDFHDRSFTATLPPQEVLRCEHDRASARPRARTSATRCRCASRVPPFPDLCCGCSRRSARPGCAIFSRPSSIAAVEVGGRNPPGGTAAELCQPRLVRALRAAPTLVADACHPTHLGRAHASAHAVRVRAGAHSWRRRPRPAAGVARRACAVRAGRTH